MPFSRAWEYVGGTQRVGVFDEAWEYVNTKPKPKKLKPNQQSTSEARKVVTNDPLRPGLRRDAPAPIKLIYDLTRPIDKLMSGNVGRLGEKIADQLLMTDRSKYGHEYTPGSSQRAEQVIDVTGAILGSLPAYGKAYSTLDKVSALNKLTPLQRIGAKGAIAGGGYEGLSGFVREETPQEIAIRTGLGIGLGAIGDVALVKGLPALGRGVNALRKTDSPMISNLDLRPTPRVPLLPAPPSQLRLPAGRIAGSLTGDVVHPQPGAVGQKALPMSRAEASIRQSVAHDMSIPKLTGEIDTTIRQDAPPLRRALPPSADETINRQYAEQMGMEWPLNTQDMANVRLARVVDDVGPTVNEQLSTAHKELTDFLAQTQPRTYGAMTLKGDKADITERALTGLTSSERRTYETLLNKANEMETSVATSLAKQARQAMMGEQNLADVIIARGGIKPPAKGQAYHAEYTESIPASTRRLVSRAKGRPIDEVADELGMSTNELLQRLQSASETASVASRRKLDIDSYLNEARAQLGSNPVYMHIEKEISKLNELSRSRTSKPKPTLRREPTQKYLEDKWSRMADKPIKNLNVWDMTKEEAAKRGVDLDDLHKTATDPEYAHWKDVVGLGEYIPTPKQAKPALPTEGELEAARNILKRTNNVERAAKILEAYPQLKEGNKRWVNRIEKAKAYKAKYKPITPPKKEPTTNFELENAKSILRNIKDLDRASRILEAFPELKPQFKGLINRIDKNKQTPNKPPTEQPKPPTKETQPPKEPPIKEPTKKEVEQAKQGRADFTPAGNKAVAKAALEGVDVAKLKDIGPVKAQLMDIFRVVSETFGGNIFKGKSTGVKRLILDPFDKSKGEMVDFEKKLADELKKNVVDKGITKDSKQSALLQDFGERKLVDGGTYEQNLEALKKKRPIDWKKFVDADDWFRKTYDDLIDQINDVYKEVYPTTWENHIIPKRKDYYRHFNELGDEFKQIRNMIETPSQIDPALVGVSENMRPKSKWLSIAQRRGQGEYKKDAVGGFLDYMRYASYHKHITPHIGRLQALGNELVERTGKSKNLNNFIQILQRHEQMLAGKTHIADRFIQETIGRDKYRVLNMLNNRVRANVILGNMGTLIAQGTHIPMAIAVGKQHAVPALKDTFKSILGWKNDPINKSDFIKERYKGYIYRQFETKLGNKAMNAAGALLETADRIATTYTWQTMYRKGLAEGAKNPIKYADDATRNITAGRGVGEVPHALQSQLSRLVVPFQIEVNNIVFVHRDLAKSDKVGLALLATTAWLFNKISEETRGSGLMFDPIMALNDAAKELTNEEHTAGERAIRAGARLGGEVLSNVVGGQHLAAAVVKDPQKRKEYFGRTDPTRYGTGLIAVEGLSDPLYKLFFKFGGGQIKKTKGGIEALMDEAVYSKDGNKMLFPVEKTPYNIGKATLFGKYGTKEGRQYFDEERKPLSEKQTEEVKSGKTTYNKVIKEREINRQVKEIDAQLKELIANKSMPSGKRADEIQKLRKQRAELKRRARE